MTGAVVTVTLDTVAASGVLARLTSAEIEGLAYSIGQLIENQTKERIDTEKRAPSGAPWAPWSKAYARRRGKANRQSLLVGRGNPGLLESIQNYTTGTEVRVGTPLIYGAIHQFGGAGVGRPGLPARPYLGLSSANERDIEDLVIGEMEALLS